jgi:hypothetical protein
MALVVYNTTDSANERFIPSAFFNFDNTFILKGTLVDVGEDGFYDLHFTVNAKIKIRKDAIFDGYPAGLDSLIGLETNLLLVKNDGIFKAKRRDSDEFSGELTFKDSFAEVFANPSGGGGSLEPLPTDVSRRVSGNSAILEACRSAHT